MKKEKKIELSELAKQVAKIKVSRKLDSIEDAPFFKKKMEKGTRILSVADLPKIKYSSSEVDGRKNTTKEVLIRVDML